MRLIISSLILVIVATSVGQAQPYPGGNNPYQRQNPMQPQKSPDLMLLENEMLETRYKANPNEHTKIAFLQSCEETLPFVCKAFQDKPEYISEQCQAHLNKIKEVDLKNKKAFCYENGFKNEECKKLGKVEETGPQGSPFEQLQRLLERPASRPQYSAAEMRDPERQKVRSYTDQILKAQMRYRETNAQNDKEAVLRLYGGVIPLVCKFTGIQPYTPNLECRNYLGQALTLDPSFPPALCYRDGPDSLHCGKSSKAPQANTPNKSQSQGGFTEF